MPNLASAARVDPRHVRARHQSMHHFVANAAFREDSRLRLLTQLHTRQISYARYNQADASLRSQYQGAWTQFDQALARDGQRKRST
jgi:hypothetical protein